MAPKKIHEHTSSCRAWKTGHGKPWPYFKYDRWAADKKSLYDSGAIEGSDFLRCLLCAEHGWDFRFSRLAQHLKAHGLDETAYGRRFPNAKVRLDKTLERRVTTTREKYGVDNVFQADTIKLRTRETMVERYGVTHNNHVPESRAKRATTNMERYGAENPFGSPVVQKQIRETMLERYGVTSPQQVPEIRQRTISTVRARYGVDHYVRSPQFKEKFKATCQKRYGVDHYMQSSKWRVSAGWVSLFADPKVQQRAHATNLRNHGGVHSQQVPEVRAKAQATWMEKYGVDNPSKCDEVKARTKDVWLGKYGVPFPPQSLWLNREHMFPNKLERQVDVMSPAVVVYAGDGSYWAKHVGAAKARNPDFVVLKPDQLQAYRDGADLNGLRTSAVIEVFGDYWHGPAKTGKEREVHQADVLAYYARCGIVALVLWEKEIKQHPKRVGERIQRFLQAWESGEFLAI